MPSPVPPMIFRDLVDDILEKLRLVANDLGGSFYEPFGAESDRYTIVLRGKIETDRGFADVVEAVKRRLRIVAEARCGKGCLRLVASEELPVVIDVAEDCAKVPYRIYLPVVWE